MLSPDSARNDFEKRKGIKMKKRTLKTIAAALAMISILTFTAAGCGNKTDDSEEFVTNVITQASDGEAQTDKNGETSDDGPQATETVLDAEGNVVTDAQGEPVTQPAATTAPINEGGSDDLFADMTTNAAPVVDTTVDSSTRYAYSTLTDNEKALYDAILSAASKMSTRIFGAQNLSSAEWTKVFGMVYNQEPQLFWLNGRSVVGRLYYNEIDPEKIASMQKEIDATVDALVKEANSKSTTFDKLKVFHDHLVLNSTFEKSDEAGNYNQTIYNAFSGGTSKQGNIQCAGYAKGMQYLCDKVGIDCMVITGTNEKGTSHAWNKVKVEGEWYNLDATWDDPILSTPITNYLRYTFFLVPDEWINEKTHFNINTVTLNSGDKVTYYEPPKATATAQNYFVKNGYVYDNRADADKALKAELEKAASEGTVVAHIMVSSDSLYNEILDALKNDSAYRDELKGVNSKIKKIKDSSKESLRVIQLVIEY